MLGIVAAALVGFLLVAAPQTASAERQPRMKAALILLNKAHKQLKLGSRDKGGHRVAAIDHVKKAIEHVNKGIKFDNKHSTPVELERQPRMKAARILLNKALNQLKKGSHDKGGHRVAAIAQVKLAIARVNKGIKFDNKH